MLKTKKTKEVKPLFVRLLSKVDEIVLVGRILTTGPYMDIRRPSQNSETSASSLLLKEVYSVVSNTANKAIL